MNYSGKPKILFLPQKGKRDMIIDHTEFKIYACRFSEMIMKA